MRIALCLSGQPRFFKVAHRYLEANLIRMNPGVDVFIHTWEYPELMRGNSFSGASWNLGRTDVYLGHQETVRELTKTYNPKVLETSKVSEVPQKNWVEYPLTNGENLAEVTHLMFYTMKKSVQLAKSYSETQGFEYDLVIRTRFDVAPLSPIELTNTPKLVHHTNSCRNPRVLSDWLFWSDSVTMYELCSVYDEIDDFVARGVLCCGEEMLTQKMIDMGVSRNPVNKSLFLVRDQDFADKSFGRGFD